MDTKSKSISHSLLVKGLVFLLVIISSLAGATCTIYLGFNHDYISSDSFEETNVFIHSYRRAVDDLISLELDLISEEHISKSSNDKKVVTNNLRKYKEVKSRVDNRINFLYYIKNLDKDSVKTNLSKSFTYLEEQYASIYYLNEEFNTINNGSSYYIPRFVFSSLERLDEFSYEFRSAVSRDLKPGDEFYQGYISYSDYKEKAPLVFSILSLSIIAFFLGLSYLLITAGRTSKDGELELSIIDKVPFEIQAVFLLGVSALELAIIFPNLGYASKFSDLYTHALTLTSLFVSIAFVGLLSLLSVTRRIKDRSFFKNFLIYKLCHKCFRLAKKVILFFWNILKGIFMRFFNFNKNIIKNSNEMISSLGNKSIFKSWILLFMFAYLVANFILVLIITNTYGTPFLLFSLVFVALNLKVMNIVYKFLRSLQKIIIASDSVSYASDVNIIDLDKIAPSLHELASNIVNIQSGIKKAVDNALKGEQMKTALITNVSHDLKTPLTSIITYVDLLKKEKFIGDDAKNYLNILEEKSYRLKTLIEDIIEVNKASTGNISVNKEKVNLNELVIQSLGEYEYKLENSNLELKINLPDSPAFIHADSNATWRVLDNLIENAIKYSAENSRIYIDVFASDIEGVLVIKNMSKLPLDISPEQLTERFVRGDSARSSEGSGLGLSIAQSLTDLQGGSFEVIIDGDLFKVKVKIPLWREVEE